MRAMSGMMSTAVAVSTKTMASLDDVIALSRVISNPQALDKLREEFASVTKEIADGIAAHEAAGKEADAKLADAEAVHAALDERESSIAAATTELKRVRDELSADQANHAAGVKAFNERADAHRAEWKKEAKAEETRIDVAARALDARAQKLAEREKAIQDAEAEIAGKLAQATAAHKKADDLITRYNGLIDRLKSVTAEAG